MRIVVILSFFLWAGNGFGEKYVFEGTGTWKNIKNKSGKVKLYYSLENEELFTHTLNYENKERVITGRIVRGNADHEVEVLDSTGKKIGSGSCAFTSSDVCELEITNSFGQVDGIVKLKKVFQEEKGIPSVTVYGSFTPDSNSCPVFSWEGHLQFDMSGGEEEDEPRRPTDKLSKALCKAAKRGDYKKSVYLLKKGADVNAICHKKGTVNPFYLAAGSGNVQLLSLLLNKGAKTDARHWVSGATALHNAVYEGHANTAKFLIDNVIDINILSYYGETALHTAVSTNNLKMIKFLLAEGADVNIGEGYFGKPLHTAVLMLRLEAVQALLAGGAEVDARDDHLRTPLYAILDGPLFPDTGWGEEKEIKPILIALLEAGADVHAKVGYLTPLKLAKWKAESSYEEEYMYKILLSYADH